MLTHWRCAASMGPCRLSLLLLAVGLPACATRPAPRASVPARPLRSATLKEVLAAYDSYCRGIETFSASGDLDVLDTRAGKAHRLGVRVVAARGGRLYIKGSVAVVTAFEIASDGERFWFQVPSRKTLWTGDAAAAPRREPDQPAYQTLRPRDISEALLPEPLDPGPGETLLLEADALSFSLVLGRVEGGRGAARRRVWLHRESLLPLRARRYDAQGDLESDVGFGGWRDGTPRDISLLRPAQGYEARFALSKVQTNLPAPEKAFAPRTPPEGYALKEVSR